MKKAIVALSILIICISSNELIRQVSFESFFPANPEEESHFIENFNSWYLEINYASMVQLSKGKHGFGLFCNNKILPGQDIIRIPLEYSVHHGVLQDYDIYWDLIYSKVREEEDALALFLLSEIRNYKKSNWNYYLKMLPSSILSPIGFSDDLLNLLNIDEIYLHTKKRISQFKLSFNDLRKLVYSLPANIKEKFIGKLSFNDYVWARWIIDSRAVTIQGKKYLVPGADFINHLDISESHESHYDKPNNEERYFIPDRRSGSFSVFASRSHERLTEILEPYNQQTNYLNFFYKGFASLNNTSDCYEVDVSKLFSLNININLFKPFFLKMNINITNLCLSDQENSFKKLEFILKILSINENESSCLAKLAVVNTKDASILNHDLCSFYTEQYKAYLKQFKLIIDNKISIYTKQLTAPVFDVQNIKNFNTLGIVLINNIQIYLQSRILLFKAVFNILEKDNKKNEISDAVKTDL